MSVGAIGTIQTATTPDPSSMKHHKLVDAAQQFEGMFLQEMLKPMSKMGKEDGDSDSDSSSDDDGGGDMSTYQSYGTEALAKAIASAGGMGIARHVIEEVEKTAKPASTSAGENSETPLKSS